MSLINPMEFERWDHCPNCHMNKIELYNYFNSPMGYKNLVDSYTHGVVPQDSFKYEVYMMRCANCGKVYPIFWYGTFPVPMFPGDDRLHNFLWCFNNAYPKY